MARSEILERILALLLEIESKGKGSAAREEIALEGLIQQVLEDSGASRESLMNAIQQRYREYRRQRLKEDRTAIARSLLKEEITATT